MENSNENLKKTNIVSIVGCIMIFIFIGILIFLSIFLNNSLKKYDRLNQEYENLSAQYKELKEKYDREQEERQAAEKSKQEYEADLKELIYEIMDRCVEIESCGNVILNVWYNSIYMIRDDKTDKYTCKDQSGVFYEDFNEALSCLFKDEDFAYTMEKIRTQQWEITSKMKEMRNPPDECKEIFEELKNYYNAYLDFADLVTIHSGSYNSFSESFEEADKNALVLFRKVEFYLD